MEFRPCIDLHNGKVKQIVGSSLRADCPGDLQTNFITDKPSSYFAGLYRNDNLSGGHIIKLGPGNDPAAEEALRTWPGNMQVGGGITLENCSQWLDSGASHVIVTSCVFRGGRIDKTSLAALVKKIGRRRLVLDLSCRRRGDDYFIVTDRWQKFTDVAITPRNLDVLAQSCDEFLIHAADVEGKCGGIEVDLVTQLGRWVNCPTTYAGGVAGMDDLRLIHSLGSGNLNVTVGSALDIFGGSRLSYREVVAYAEQTKKSAKAGTGQSP
ncbi:MAG TPA: phosphoribosylformimino-5-aminoimidazole carboxamide ribotide isomerase [Desulfopila sp.]|nr:phosphoribosylformimino-5-aminoimidazole carboxamide ribotide isomerase [Desulfopila sp.]